MQPTFNKQRSPPETLTGIRYSDFVNINIDEKETDAIRVIAAVSYCYSAFERYFAKPRVLDSS
jgi:hypothetical protein